MVSIVFYEQNVSFLDTLALDNDPIMQCIYKDGVYNEWMIIGLYFQIQISIDIALAHFEGDIWVSAIDTQNVGERKLQSDQFMLGFSCRYRIQIN